MYGWVFWLVVLFVLGTAIGSMLNVCIARLPLEKSLLWPGSRCGHCLQPIRWYDNIPLLSYWLLRGRCRMCGARFSIGYFLVELATGIGLAGLFYLEVVANIHGWKIFAVHQQDIAAGLIPWQAWAVVGYHGLLFCFLLTAAVCDMGRREIPLSLTLTGTFVGLIGTLSFAWPFPAEVAPNPQTVGQFQQAPQPWWFPPPLNKDLPTGVCPWPVWWPLPAWLPPGSWQLGLATGVAGLLAGTLLLRGVRFTASTAMGVEALGLGDADLMMMAGSFLGWQLVVFAFFLSVFPALLFAVVQLVVRRDNSLPFGPALAASIVFNWLYWDRFSTNVQHIFFWTPMLIALTVAGAIFLFGASWVLGLRRR
jgi:leader peptidase (prepilin peptidase)/N-methyltransferase